MKTWLCCCIAALGLALGAHLAQADPQDPTRDKPLPDPAMESEARVFMREIRCVVCQSQSIDESDAEIAAQMRNAVREQMAAGKTQKEIRDFLVARYGDFVLMKPPFKWETALLWIGPFSLAGIGLCFIYFQRGRLNSAASGRSSARDLSVSERERLRRVLEAGRIDTEGP
jgi:cytochrome c-type biogenesis protein CcmH